MDVKPERRVGLHVVSAHSPSARVRSCGAVRELDGAEPGGGEGGGRGAFISTERDYSAVYTRHVNTPHCLLGGWQPHARSKTDVGRPVLQGPGRGRGGGCVLVGEVVVFAGHTCMSECTYKKRGGVR